MLDLSAPSTPDLNANAALASRIQTLEMQRRHHAQTAADFELMLNQLLHATRSVMDPRIHAVRAKAQDLVRRKGSSSPLRAEDCMAMAEGPRQIKGGA